MKLGKDFEAETAECRVCSAASRLRKCTICDNEHEERYFEARNIEEVSGTGSCQNKVCQFCRGVGFTPRDSYEYYCTLCGPTKRMGRGNFNAEWALLQKWRAAEEKPTLLCTSCEKTHER